MSRDTVRQARSVLLKRGFNQVETLRRGRARLKRTKVLEKSNKGAFLLGPGYSFKDNDGHEEHTRGHTGSPVIPAQRSHDLAIGSLAATVHAVVSPAVRRGSVGAVGQERRHPIRGLSRSGHWCVAGGDAR